jgi:ribosomal protein L11 methyltransferase
MPTCKLIWTGPRLALDAASERLADALGCAVSLIKDDPTAEDEASGWRLEAYFEERPDTGAITDMLAPLAGLGEAQFEELPDIDWVAHALAGLGIVRAGRFVLYGIHDADKLPNDAGDIALRIDANQAFGTGHHPTTAGCLTLLDRLAGIRPERVLDLGTGSAVLAIAAAKLWDAPVLATDIDEKSVEIARENAALNAAGDLVEFAVADGFAHEMIEAGAPFDFVFANILAGPLVELAPAMAAHVKYGGRVMLAGLMAEQEDKVAAAYEAAGFRRLNRLDHKVWPVLLYVRV